MFRFEENIYPFCCGDPQIIRASRFSTLCVYLLRIWVAPDCSDISRLLSVYGLFCCYHFHLAAFTAVVGDGITRQSPNGVFCEATAFSGSTKRCFFCVSCKNERETSWRPSSDDHSPSVSYNQRESTSDNGEWIWRWALVDMQMLSNFRKICKKNKHTNSSLVQGSSRGELFSRKTKSNVRNVCCFELNVCFLSTFSSPPFPGEWIRNPRPTTKHIYTHIEMETDIILQMLQLLSSRGIMSSLSMSLVCARRKIDYFLLCKWTTRDGRDDFSSVNIIVPSENGTFVLRFWYHLYL